MPSTTRSSIPGAAVETTSITPDGGESLGDPPEAVLAEVLLERQRRRQGEQSGVADELGEHRLAVELDGEHAQPGVGRRTGENAVTVVLPTPPFPATTVTLAAESSGTTSTALRRHLCAD